MWSPIRVTSIVAATIAAAVALTPGQPDGAARSAEIMVFSSAAPRGVLRELTPEFERTTGHRLVIK
jgi:ABC-type molybdate transport system substrate-binding protein